MSTLERIKVIAHGLAVQFGPSCEVMIYKGILILLLYILRMEL